MATLAGDISEARMDAAEGDVLAPVLHSPGRPTPFGAPALSLPRCVRCVPSFQLFQNESKVNPKTNSPLFATSMRTNAPHKTARDIKSPNFVKNFTMAPKNTSKQPLHAKKVSFYATFHQPPPRAAPFPQNRLRVAARQKHLFLCAQTCNPSAPTNLRRAPPWRHKPGAHKPGATINNRAHFETKSAPFARLA